MGCLRKRGINLYLLTEGTGGGGKDRGVTKSEHHGINNNLGFKILVVNSLQLTILKFIKSTLNCLLDAKNFKYTHLVVWSFFFNIASQVSDSVFNQRSRIGVSASKSNLIKFYQFRALFN